MLLDHFLQQASLEELHVQAMWWWLSSSCLQPTPVASQLFDMSVFAFDTYEFGLLFCTLKHSLPGRSWKQLRLQQSGQKPTEFASSLKITPTKRDACDP